MSGGPPLGQPWHANVGNNPNINREPPPPPINAGPAPQAPPHAAAHGGQQQVVVEQQHAPIYGPPLPIGIGGPAFGIAPPFGVGIGGAFPPVFSGIGMDPFTMMGGGPPYGGGPLAPIRTGNFLPGAHHGIAQMVCHSRHLLLVPSLVSFLLSHLPHRCGLVEVSRSEMYLPWEA
jgi:hypothetical protein